MDQPRVSEQPFVAALVGTPNSGKTSLFNALSGLNQRVGNFPGVTVERKSTILSLAGNQQTRLIDLPGTNSLYPASEDEEVTFSVLHDTQHKDYPDKIVVVADATQLRRGLMLATQVLDLGFPTILVLTMMDLADKEGLRIDIDQLSSLLDIPVIPVSVKANQGLDQLKLILSQPQKPSGREPFQIPPGFIPSLQQIGELQGTYHPYRAYQALIAPELFPGLSQGKLSSLRQEAKIDETSARQLISNELLVRLDRADEWMSVVVQDPPTFREQLSEKLDQILTHKIWGYAIFIGILLMVFQAVFAWATVPMDWIDAATGAFQSWLGDSLPEHWLSELLTDGLVAGLGGIIIFIPQIALLFFFITLLEETGYMARVVYLMDRIMRPFGFSGKSIIPLMGGMACAIPSIMMSRGIANKKERLITIMVTPLMSCSARIPVYTLLISMFLPAERIFGIDQRGLFMTAIYLLGFVAALLVAWVFKKVLKYESQGMFVMEMPSYRFPRWRNVGLTVYQKSRSFVVEAGQVIIVISLILWALVRFGPTEDMAAIDAKYQPYIQQEIMTDSLALAYDSEKLNSSYAAMLGKFIEPAIRPLGYDWKIGISLITSFAAREVFVGTMSIIYQMDDPEELDENGQEQGRLSLIERLQQEKHPETGLPVYTAATVLSLIVFYALAMQCMSTLAVTRKEAGWKWAMLMLVYLTVMAYVGAFIAYQLMA